ncbi:MAG: hypothetical protein ACRD3M_12945 [Thermoanaerobaculia bacterium]
MKRAGIPLAGSALLVAVALLRLPPPRELLRPVATPFDRARDPGAGPAFVLFLQASSLIPEGAHVAVGAASRNAEETIYAYQLAAGLLPNRNVVSALQAFLPDGPRMDFLIVLGGEPPPLPRARCLLRVPQGTVWRLDG